MSEIGFDFNQGSEEQPDESVRGSQQRLLTREARQRRVREGLIRALENFVKENDTIKKQKAIFSRSSKAPDGRPRTWASRAEWKSEEEINKEKNRKLLDAMDEKLRDAEINRNQLGERFGPLFEDYRTSDWMTLTFVVALLVKNTIVGICVGLQQGLSVSTQSDASKSLNM